MLSKLFLSIIIGSYCLFNTAIAKEQNTESLLQSAQNLKSNIINTPQTLRNSKIDLNFSFTNFSEYQQVIANMDNLRSTLFHLSEESDKFSLPTKEAYKQLVIWAATTKVSVFAYESQGTFSPVKRAPVVTRTILINNCEIPAQIVTLMRAEFQRSISNVRSDFVHLRTGSAGGGRRGANRTLRSIKYGEAVQYANEINDFYKNIAKASHTLSDRQREVLNSLGMEISSDTYESGDFGAYNVFQVFRNDSGAEYFNAISDDVCE